MPRRTGKKARKPKKISYELIAEKGTVGKPMYSLLSRLVENHHQDLEGARIALAWNLTWKPDVDGRVTLGKCKKASDLDRELAEFDFVIMLRKEFWQHVNVTDVQRMALLDHELCHAAVAYDKDGEPIEDEKGRKVYRIRKHDIEEFSQIVHRHGLWKRDLEEFAKALQSRPQQALPLDPDVPDVLEEQAQRQNVVPLKPPVDGDKGVH